MRRPALEACVASPETRRKIDEDVAYAAERHADATPLVLVSGRRGTSLGPFLFSMILTQGRERHPAFDALPQANLSAHIH